MAHKSITSAVGILVCSFFIFNSAGLHAADDPAKKPNFIVILSDDQTYRAIGYNNPVVKTPNMDRLANEGFRFDRFFVASPICVASRASIYTGVYPQQHGAVSLFGRGFVDNVVRGKKFVTLPATMSAAGYHTALWGKSHLGEPTTFGFDEGEEFHDPNDEQTFAAAEKFLARESKSQRPFLLWLTPRNPHLPLSAPQRFKDIYKDADITLDPNWRESPLMESQFNQGPAGAISFRDSVPIYPRAPKGLIAGPPRDEAAMKEVIKHYYGDVSCLDEQIGTLVAQLKASGLYENTIIIYLSDNGYHLGNHGLGNKVTMHEESVRVPMFIHSPLLANKRTKSDALTSSLDIFPTILAFAGVAAPPQLMGKSLRPILDSPTVTVRDHVVTECVGPPDQRRGVGHRMVRTDHLKYIVTSSDEEAFFDLSSDPYELKNLIADATRKEEIERHRKLLHEWSASVGEKRLPMVEVKETKPAEGRRGKPDQAKNGKAQAPMPHNGTKLLIVNDDGFSAFHSGRYKTAEDLRKSMLSYKDTQVAVMEWCMIAGSRANYPSKVTGLIGDGMTEFPRRGDKLAHETLKRMADAGENTLKIVADACHEAGLACYGSLRMNGDYSEDMWGGSFPKFANSTFWWEHPEFRQRDAKGKVLAKFSFAVPEVREFKLNILREVAAQDIDGINLDFQRHPNFFGFEDSMAKAFKAKYGVEANTVDQDDPRWTPLRYEIMTSFVRDVRKILDEAGKLKGRHLGLSARIDWKKYPSWGCDVETWLKKGLLDYLVIGQYGLGGYEFDITPFVKMAKGTGCAVLFGEEATVKGHDRTAEEDRLIAAGKMKPLPSTLLTREQYEARAAKIYAAGADGLHLFNEGRKDMFKGLGDVKP